MFKGKGQQRHLIIIIELFVSIHFGHVRMLSLSQAVRLRFVSKFHHHRPCLADCHV